MGALGRIITMTLTTDSYETFLMRGASHMSTKTFDDGADPGHDLDPEVFLNGF